MKLPEKAILEFIEMYRLKYGELLTYAEAEDRAQKLFNLYVLSQGQNC